MYKCYENGDIYYKNRVKNNKFNYLKELNRNKRLIGL